MRARAGLLGVLVAVTLPLPASAIPLVERGVGYLNLVGFLQPRLEFVEDDTRCPAGAATCPRASRVTEHDFGGGGFRLRRARVGFEGRLHELVGFEATVELADAGAPALADGFVDLLLSEYLVLRLGQFKVPFGREALVPESRLQFVEPSLLVAGGFADRNPSGLGTPGRDVGIMMTNAFGDGTLVELQTGLFDGDGPNVVHNSDDGTLFAVRLALHPLGAPGRLEESDVAREEEPKVTVGLDFATNRAGGEGSATELDADGIPTSSYEERTNLYGADLAFFWEGISLYGEMLYRFWRSTDPTLRDEVGFGFVLQGGYLLPIEDLDRHIELAFRYDQYDPIRCESFDCPANVPAPADSKDPTLGRRAYTIGANFFFTGDHNWKLQMNYVRADELDHAASVDHGLDDDAFLVQMTAQL